MPGLPRHGGFRRTAIGLPDRGRHSAESAVVFIAGVPPSGRYPRSPTMPTQCYPMFDGRARLVRSARDVLVLNQHEARPVGRCRDNTTANSPREPGLGSVVANAGRCGPDTGPRLYRSQREPMIDPLNDRDAAKAAAELQPVSLRAAASRARASSGSRCSRRRSGRPHSLPLQLGVLHPWLPHDLRRVGARRNQPGSSACRAAYNAERLAGGRRRSTPRAAQCRPA